MIVWINFIINFKKLRYCSNFSIIVKTRACEAVGLYFQQFEYCQRSDNNLWAGMLFLIFFHISNLNKDITAMTISRDTFSHHAIVNCGSEHESSDIHMLQRNPARAILQGRPPAWLLVPPTPSLCIFLEKQELEEKPRFATVL